MKRIVVLFAVVLLATVAFAQNAPKAELFGGYQFTSVDGNNLGIGDRQSMHGFNVDFGYRAAKNVSLVADFGLASKSYSETIEGTTATAKVKMYPFLFGPRFSTTKGKVTPFAEVLFGIAHVSLSAEATGLGTISDSRNKFSYAFGGGLDVNANDKIAIRLAKFDYVGVRGGSDFNNLNNFRLATGIVFNF